MTIDVDRDMAGREARQPGIRSSDEPGRPTSLQPLMNPARRSPVPLRPAPLVAARSPMPSPRTLGIGRWNAPGSFRPLSEPDRGIEAALRRALGLIDHPKPLATTVGQTTEVTFEVTAAPSPIAPSVPDARAKADPMGVTAEPVRFSPDQRLWLEVIESELRRAERG